MSLAPVEMRTEQDAYRVMVVDDSAVIRGLISRWLEADPAIRVVATAHNGAMALRHLLTSRAEVVILDVEMPEMDGMTALPQIIAAAPNIQVIMASTLTRRNAEISMKALAAGAADYVPKPSSSREVNTSPDFRRTVIEKVKVLGAVARELDRTSRRDNRPASKVARPVAPSPVPVRPVSPRRPIELRAPSATLPRVLAIGSSTGGPQALFEFFAGLKPAPAVPILITQHMPPTFTAILADHLARANSLACREAVDGEALTGGHVYVAPGDHHLTVAERGGRPIARVTQGPAENFCRPSVDPMLRGVAEVYGPAALAIILTGMGNDGLGGCRAVVAAGGTVLAQDEATSVVWGMPGAVALAGLASAVLPLQEIAPRVSRFMKGDRE